MQQELLQDEPAADLQPYLECIDTKLQLHLDATLITSLTHQQKKKPKTFIIINCRRGWLLLSGLVQLLDGSV